MVIALPLISIIAALCVLPGWILAKRRRLWSAWILALPFLGIGLWGALAMLGLGSQSLGNVVEVLIVAAAAVVTSYLVFVVIGRLNYSVASGTAIAYIVVAAVAVCLRLFMPVFPE
jgi:hypothetical protein